MIQASTSEPAEANGRRTDGKFGHGNSFGRGNPTAKHAQRLRQMFVNSVTEEDVKAIVTKLVELAKAGDIQAANLLLTRALGKPSTSDNSLPLDDEPERLPTREELGPVTKENIEQHRAILMRDLQSKARP